MMKVFAVLSKFSWQRKCSHAVFLVRRQALLFFGVTSAVGMLGIGPVLAQQIETNNGTNGANGTSGSPNGGTGTAGGDVLYSVTTPTIGADNGYQSIWVAALSQGGSGGNGYQETDQNGKPLEDSNNNPVYEGSSGLAGNGGNVTLTNSGAVTIDSGVTYQPTFQTGYGVRVLTGNSTGGNAGLGYGYTYGGASGGSGLDVSVTDTGALSLTLGWGADQLSNVEGIGAISKGGNGTASYMGQKGSTVYNGGNGGNAGSVTLDLGGNVTINETTPAYFQSSAMHSDFPTPLAIFGSDTLVGAGVVASSWSGSGGDGYDHSTGGHGGSAQSVNLSVTNASISVTAIQGQEGTRSGLIPDILAESTGGSGGNGGLGQNHSSGGAGGNTGNVGVTLTTTGGGSSPQKVLSNSYESPAIVAISTSGNGGNGTDYNQFNVAGAGGNGGAAGMTGTVGVTIGNQFQISTFLPYSQGIIAESVGGNGGNGGYYGGGLVGDGGNGGEGGAGSAVNVSVGESNISTFGGNSPAIYMQSLGGNGGNGGYSGDPADADGGNGGGGGGTGDIAVTIAAGGSVYTWGNYSAAVEVLSTGGIGGTAGNANSSVSSGGTSGNGGSTGKVTINNNGWLQTAGADSPGIIVTSRTGTGGQAGTSDGVFYSSGANGGNAGTLGAITLTNSGSISTSGTGSAAVEIQTLGGGGGYGGDAEGAYLSLGGTAGAGANGGDVNATLAGAILTVGSYSFGLQAQSIGGGGGVAGNASTDGLGIGGSGNSGGNGGQVNVNASGTINTLGTGADGIEVQSIGGGGGTGGQSDSFVAIGGAGSSGGNGGIIQVTNTGKINTFGSEASGILAESIGGGGGSAGDALQGAISIGGSSSTTANGGAVTVNSGGTILTSGPNAYGDVALSVGGGGGNAGNSTGFITIGGTVSGDNPSGGGPGGTATVDATGSVTTLGEFSAGLSALSIGGGGGIGGSSTSDSAFVSVSVGGTGGSGGAGSTATVAAGPGTNVATKATNALGILALSVGGGGGVGGAGNSASYGVGFSSSVSVGGAGGGGGNGGATEVNLNGAKVETGLYAADAVDPATVTPGSVVPPLPVDAYGVVALSVGGGGGVGGASTAAAYVADMPVPETDSSFGIAGSFAFGGAGGDGGSGGAATINLSNGSSVVTQGNGSHALLAQSIGGGGGDGGTSSTQSAAYGFKNVATLTGRQNFNLTLGLGLGGTGGSGGNGGSVDVSLGGVNLQPDVAGALPTQVVTYGDDADGVLAQSVGGGGGNAGIGSGSTQNSTSAATALAVNLTVGSSGGAGGLGGNVNVADYANSAIYTGGSSSDGIFAQSVGGGGGTSSGGSYQIGLPSINTLAKIAKSDGIGKLGANPSSITVNAGTDGASGQNGGEVTVDVSGTISTNGQDAKGVFAQSVGGGGGTAGSAGSDGSSDNPYQPNSFGDWKKLFNNTAGNAFSAYVVAMLQGKNAPAAALLQYLPTVNINLSFGASGGGGGNGGTVNINLNGAMITTAGDYADAVVAQSVGGGGGDGGAALAGGSQGIGSLLKINANFALGGDAGVTGTGGSTAVNLNGATIKTAGYAASGIFAQSVGGGGGVAGSAETNGSGVFSLGVSSSGNAGSGGNGGTVSLVQAGADATTIATSGDTAHAIVLQSVGDGGGVVQSGFTLTEGVTAPGTVSQKLFDGSSSVSTGSGGNVTLDPNALPLLKVTTAGTDAYGILAQSVGGGGGISGEQPGTVATYELGGASANEVANNGGSVSVNLAQGSSIETTGDGSHAIFAQSVGGGGGIAGFASGSTLLYEASAANGSGHVTTGNGGDVTVNTGGTSIITTGASAYGIFAQSVGAGGGLESGNDGASEIAGTTGATGSSGTGGLVTVFDNGTINASGVNAVGIFAQSIGQNGSGLGNSAGVAITVNGSLSGGSGTQGRGIWVDSDYSTNNVTIGSSGLVRSASKQAIVSTGYGITNVQNYGTVIGTVTLKDKNSTLGTFTNEAGGLWISRGSLSGNFVNAGRIAPLLANNYEAVSVAGDFQQTANGVYAPNVQFDTRKADVLLVTGNAQLAGIVEPVAQSVLPWVSVPIMTVDGTVSGRLSAGSSPLFGYEITKTAASSDASIGGNETQYLLTNVSADFDPSGIKLSALQSSIARALFSSWAAGGNASFGTLYGALDNLAQGSIGSYTGALSNLAPEAAVDYASREVSNLEDFAGDLDGCDRNGGDYLALSNGRCAWFTLSGNLTSQSSSYGAARFALNQSTYAIGGETRLSHNLYLDAALAYQNSWLSAQGSTLKGSGQAGYGGVGLRDEVGDWSFMGGLFGSGGAYTTSRVINLPGEQSIVKGSPAIDAVGVRTGAAYMFGFGSAYIRPRLTLDGLYINMPGYTESGSSVDVTKSNGSSQGIFVATPSVEFGKSFTLRHGMELRLSFLTGVSLQSSDSWTQSYGFIAAPAGTPDFNTTVAMDTATARIGVGLQLVKMGRYSLRAEYNGAFSKHTSVNAGDIALHATF